MIYANYPNVHKLKQGRKDLINIGIWIHLCKDIHSSS